MVVAGAKAGGEMKRNLVRSLAIVCYCFGIDALFYWLNRRCKRVITFHNVMPDAMFDSRTTALSDSETSFRRKVRFLKRKWKIDTNFNNPKSVTLTFDDGFVNEIEIAGRILGEEGVPAVLFAAIGLVGERDPMKCPVIDLITHWNAGVPNGCYSICGKEVTYTSNNRFANWVQVIRTAYAADGENYGRQVLKELDSIYPMGKVLGAFSAEYIRLRLTGVSAEQIAAVRRKGWLVGSHSVNHYQFSSIPQARRDLEFRTPDAQMKSVPFSYPYGDLASIDEDTMRRCEAAGYPAAFSNSANAEGRQSRYFLPRFALEGDAYLDHFELSGLKTFIKTRKLLPVWKI